MQCAQARSEMLSHLAGAPGYTCQVLLCSTVLGTAQHVPPLHHLLATVPFAPPMIDKTELHVSCRPPDAAGLAGRACSGRHWHGWQQQRPLRVACHDGGPQPQVQAQRDRQVG